MIIKYLFFGSGILHWYSFSVKYKIHFDPMEKCFEFISKGSIHSSVISISISSTKMYELMMKIINP